MTAQAQKVALVTGAAKRIGRDIALALAQRGWDVAVHYGSSAEAAQATVREIERLGRRAAAVQCDLADEAAVKALLPHVAQVLGPARCVVNNASVFGHDTCADLAQACLDRHMHTNLVAPVLLAQALYDATPSGAQAVVVNLLDQKLFNLNPDFLSYTLSKAALHTATTMLAQALAPKVRVVGVAPGITLVSGNQTEEEFAKAHTMTPLGRSSTPDDVASTVCFVAENAAITGTTLLVDGGQHLIPLQRDVMFVAK
ncbi:MAG TPA: SDR family oxidoreductase [Noviherbaspirillum sp.]|uniref:SDR family oxidoreductase n=1 Tax=Noviherbaspirillum sp. TaxID=1926288 RepID=UPI002B468E53|nr:SDR family oxidoreductase [Noviherbaspirillum sp.]HJV88406.1 SDR family oxidoreductase [Noviherbaspirillum sp.]